MEQQEQQQDLQARFLRSVMQARSLAKRWMAQEAETGARVNDARAKMKEEEQPWTPQDRPARYSLNTLFIV